MEIPKKCPECSSKIEKDNDGQVAYRCVNASCPKQLERLLVHFASRGAMDIEGLGESVVTQLIQKDLAKDLADIYFLKREDLLGLELFKDKKADNLINAIAESRKCPLSKFLFGLGIFNIGEKAAYVLAQRFINLDSLMKAEQEDLEDIQDIGFIMAGSLVKFFKLSSTKKLITKFKKAGVNMNEPVEEKNYKLAGRRFVFTGELQGVSRNDAQSLVKKLGGGVTSSVSKKTSYVVAGNNPGSKYKKAIKLGVEVLNLKQFREMINE